VFGGMSDVVEHSMQHMTDADLTAIARYLKTLPPAIRTTSRTSTTSRWPKPVER
jgi:cytochrome c553